MIRIHEITTQQIEHVSRMLCRCYGWLGNENGLSPQQIDFLISKRASVETIESESRRQLYLVASNQNTVVGLAAVNSNELAKLFVDPAYHNQGIGTILFQSAQQAIANQGHNEMIVGVMARSAIGFYEKMGMIQYSQKHLNSGAFSGTHIPLMKKALGYTE